MFEQFIYPTKHEPQVLDQMLAIGWFRMGQSLFTTNFVTFQHRIYRTIWLRNRLKDYVHTKTYHNLRKRNANFRIELKNFAIDEAHEQLFQTYRQAMPFQTSRSLTDLMYFFASQPGDVFNTYEINLYDQNKLIACSYFDVGHKSAEGISSYYHPDYKNHSLGKYLIYLQIDICLENKLDFFYPGYFVPCYTHLDYKLSIGSSCLEFINTEDLTWYDISEYTDQGLPIELAGIAKDLFRYYFMRS
jgi:arginine-tRNA-protein transferase